MSLCLKLHGHVPFWERETILSETAKNVYQGAMLISLLGMLKSKGAI